MAKAMKQVPHPLFAWAFDGTAWKIEDRAELSDGPIGPTAATRRNPGAPGRRPSFPPSCISHSCRPPLLPTTPGAAVRGAAETRR